MCACKLTKSNMDSVKSQSMIDEESLDSEVIDLLQHLIHATDRSIEAFEH